MAAEDQTTTSDADVSPTPAASIGGTALGFVAPVISEAGAAGVEVLRGGTTVLGTARQVVAGPAGPALLLVAAGVGIALLLNRD